MRVPRVSDAEAEVMKALWAIGPATSGQVVAALQGTTRWKPRTIKTLLARLVRKKVVGSEKAGRAYLYRPLVDEATFSRAQRKSFLSRFYGGALKPMLAAFIEEENLTPEDVAELRALLDRKETRQP